MGVFHVEKRKIRDRFVRIIRGLIAEIAIDAGLFFSVDQILRYGD